MPREAASGAVSQQQTRLTKEAPGVMENVQAALR